MMTLPLGDAFGRAVLDHLETGAPATYTIERDDGWADSLDAAQYFGDMTAWANIEVDLISHAGERVLDIGAGAGRVSLWLQVRDIDVVALDVSPGAVEVCRARGVKTTYLGTVESLARTDTEPFDTFVMFGNNLGLLGSPHAAARLLEAITNLSTPGARILGTTIDPYDTTDPAHLAYHQRNRDIGRMPGQITARVVYQGVATPWFDLLWTSLDELRDLIEPQGWSLTRQLAFGPIRGVVLDRIV